MTCRQLAEELLKNPNAIVLVKNGSDWIEVLGVEETGEHRNAVTFKTIEEMSPGVPGVIVHQE